MERLEDRIAPTVTPMDDSFEVPWGPYTATASVLANDISSTNSPMRVEMWTTPAYAATFTISAGPDGDGTFSFAPVAGFVGVEQFTYWPLDGDAPEGPPVLGTVTLTVGDPPPPVNGNYLPIIAPIANQNGIEGRTVSLQVFAADFDDETTYSAQQLPAGLTINATTGLISGKLRYTCERSYTVSITVTDAQAASATATFTWSVEDATLWMFSGNEMNQGIGTPNCVLVNSQNTNTLFVSPGNTVELRMHWPVGANEPLRGDILYRVDGSGAMPPDGSFASHVWPDISFSGAAGTYTAKVGIDLNANDILDAIEVSHQFSVRLIDFTGADVGSQRAGGGPIEPALTPIKTWEHFEVGGAFLFQVMGGVAGRNSLIRYELWQSGFFQNTLLASDSGTSFVFTFGPSTANSTYQIRFYADRNNNSSYDPGELWLACVPFAVTQPRVFSLNVRFSSSIPNAGTFGSLQAMQARFDRARDLLLSKDSETDWRAAVQFDVASSAMFTSTPSGGDRPDPVVTAADQVQHFNNLEADVVFVNSLNGIFGMTWHNWHEIIMGYSDCSNGNEGNLAKTLAHEIGHGVGLDHPDPADNRFIMTQGWGGGAFNELGSLSDAVAYDIGSSSVKETPQQDGATPVQDAIVARFSGPDVNPTQFPIFEVPVWLVRPLMPDIVWTDDERICGGIVPIPTNENRALTFQRNGGDFTFSDSLVHGDAMDILWSARDPFDNPEEFPWYG